MGHEGCAGLAGVRALGAIPLAMFLSALSLSLSPSLFPLFQASSFRAAAGISFTQFSECSAPRVCSQARGRLRVRARPLSRGIATRTPVSLSEGNRIRSRILKRFLDQRYPVTPQYT